MSGSASEDDAGRALTVLAILLAVAAALAIAFGPGGSIFALAAGDGGRAGAWELVVVHIRLPRALLAIGIGASLGLAGAALQALFRNPLVEPGLVGVSALAALGAVLAFYSGFAAAVPLGLPLGGIAGALVAVALLFGIARRGADSATFILIGVALNSFGGALTALVLNLAPSPYAVYEIFFWLLGSLANRSFEHVILALPFMLAGCALMLQARSALGTLALGDDVARTLGVNIGRLRLRVIAGAALAVGAAVAVSGIVGFVGLVVPHLARFAVGANPVRLLPASALGGAILVIGADLVARQGPWPGELRLGVVTALLGAPFFIWLLARRQAVML